jgi:hypothetical protein
MESYITVQDMAMGLKEGESITFRRGTLGIFVRRSLATDGKTFHYEEVLSEKAIRQANFDIVASALERTANGIESARVNQEKPE